MTFYEEKQQQYRSLTEQTLNVLCNEYLPETSRVCQAARYSLLGGGKRVRAVLVLAACELLGGDVGAAAHFAAAVEMLHCYSLIHDDLPCMDNDDFRRGQPSCHKVYGEATALLAGDALLTTAFETISKAPLPAQARADAAKALAFGAGARGMVWGQELDLAFENVPADKEQLQQIHQNKTGALINAAVQMGVAAAAGQAEDSKRLEQYAFDLGLVFQIVDDVLDVTSTEEELGKPIGSDAENGKSTFVSLYGVAEAMQMAEKITSDSCKALQAAYGDKAKFLIKLAQALVERKN